MKPFPSTTNRAMDVFRLEVLITGHCVIVNSESISTVLRFDEIAPTVPFGIFQRKLKKVLSIFLVECGITTSCSTLFLSHDLFFLWALLCKLAQPSQPHSRVFFESPLVPSVAKRDYRVVHNIGNNFVASPKFSGNLSFPLVSARETMDHPTKERSMLLVETNIRRGRENTRLALHTVQFSTCQSLSRQFFSSSSFSPLSARSTSLDKLQNKQTNKQKHEGPGNKQCIALHML